MTNFDNQQSTTTIRDLCNAQRFDTTLNVSLTDIYIGTPDRYIYLINCPNGQNPKIVFKVTLTVTNFLFI